MFSACLSLPKNPREAQLVAEHLEALARALHEWPTNAWKRITADQSRRDSLFERLVAQAAPLALDPTRRTEALASAECTAAVLRCLWPEARVQAPAEPSRIPALV
jgi:hypothetical protein